MVCFSFDKALQDFNPKQRASTTKQKWVLFFLAPLSGKVQMLLENNKTNLRNIQNRRCVATAATNLSKKMVLKECR
jgi:hypothetical protein